MNRILISLLVFTLSIAAVRAQETGVLVLLGVGDADNTDWSGSAMLSELVWAAPMWIKSE